MEKYYLICHDGKQMETVSPRQAKTTDNVLFQADAEVWNDFRHYMKGKIFDLTADQLKKEWKNFEGEWYRQLRIERGYARA